MFRNLNQLLLLKESTSFRDFRRLVSMVDRCFLRCSSGSHPDILLPDCVRVVVGRGPNTRIKDKRCSREQLALTARYDGFSVDVEQVGMRE